ncbi:MAG: Hsp20/alpha crystallin family protein [Saprospiraceae bacterium]|nr:Hsp20/alpha crystallin family protein [Saprospiraceae bacterium]
MSLIKYDPFAPVRSLTNVVDEFFNRGIGELIGYDHAFSVPSVNVVEKPDSFTIEVAAPGLEKGDFKVSVENGCLVISAKKEKNEEVKEGKYTRREFNYTSFSRSFTLPETVNYENVHGNYENGVLRVQLPKREVAQIENARVIEIE